MATLALLELAARFESGERRVPFSLFDALDGCRRPVAAGHVLEKRTFADFAALPGRTKGSVIHVEDAAIPFTPAGVKFPDEHAPAMGVTAAATIAASALEVEANSSSADAVTPVLRIGHV